MELEEKIWVDKNPRTREIFENLDEPKVNSKIQMDVKGSRIEI